MQDYELQWLRQDMIEEIYHVLTVSDETNMNMVIDSLNDRTQGVRKYYPKYFEIQVYR